MSTKIYDTVYNKDENNNILAFIQKEKEKVVDNREEYLNKFLDLLVKDFSFNALNKISRNNMGKKREEPSWNNLLFASLGFYYNDFERAYLNTELSIVNYDLKRSDIKLKGTLLQFFGMNGFSLKDRIEKMPGSRNFDYYNNTDMDIREDEEDLRKRTWDKVFKESSIPSKAGDVIIIYNFIEDYMKNKEQVFENIERLFFDKLNDTKKVSREENIYIKVKIDTALKEIKKEKNVDIDLTMSQFLKAERSARECFKNNIPFTSDELIFADYIKDELEKTFSDFLNPESKEKIMNVIKLKLDTSIEKTLANKIEADNRFKEFEKDMEELKKNKVKIKWNNYFYLLKSTS